MRSYYLLASSLNPFKNAFSAFSFYKASFLSLIYSRWLLRVTSTALSLADIEVKRSFSEPTTGTLLFCFGGRRIAFSSLWFTFFSERIEGGGGISAANSLRMCLVTSSSRMSLGSDTMFFAALTRDLLLRYLSRDF